MNDTQNDAVHHSKPIPISTQHFRHRSTSFSSDSSASPTESPPLVTPCNTRMPVSSSSPILYFLSQSPSKPPATFPFRGFAPPPLIEDEPSDDFKPPAHARRGSINRFPPQLPITEPHHERGVNVLRRLSFGAPLGKSSSVNDIPQPPRSPPNFTAADSFPSRKPRRSVTITGQTRPHRAPSPMGERILKGHFDGFN